jgi:gamma-glutamylcyclotransferase (GGCT)/AIG2-like uncharacterized protein YtfP
MNNPGVYRLFVYGSLRSGFQSHAYEYISKYFELEGNAKVKGVLNIFISGELYNIRNENEFNWAIGQLDDYEGVDVAFDEEQLYRRELTDVYYNDQIIPAWIYWFSGDVSGKPVIESGDMLEYLRQKK